MAPLLKTCFQTHVRICKNLKISTHFWKLISWDCDIEHFVVCQVQSKGLPNFGFLRNCQDIFQCVIWRVLGKTGISIEVGRFQYSPLSIDGKIDETQSDCNLHINDDLGQIDNRYVVILGIGINIYPWYRECVSTGAAGAQTCRSLGNHLLHPQILRLLVLCAPADFEAQSSLL